jgi:hypothetical protein
MPLPCLFHACFFCHAQRWPEGEGAALKGVAGTAWRRSCMALLRSFHAWEFACRPLLQLLWCVPAGASGV